MSIYDTVELNCTNKARTAAQRITATGFQREEASAVILVTVFLVSLLNYLQMIQISSYLVNLWISSKLMQKRK